MSQDRVLVDCQAAAHAVGLRPVTIRRWATKGWLERRGQDKQRRTLYDLADVYEVFEDKHAEDR